MPLDLETYVVEVQLGERGGDGVNRRICECQLASGGETWSAVWLRKRNNSVTRFYSLVAPRPFQNEKTPSGSKMSGRSSKNALRSVCQL